MPPLKEKVESEARDLPDEPGRDIPRSQEEKIEGENRRVGIFLIVIGCVLMALAAEQAYALETIPNNNSQYTDRPVNAIYSLCVEHHFDLSEVKRRDY